MSNYIGWNDKQCEYWQAEEFYSKGFGFVVADGDGDGRNIGEIRLGAKSIGYDEENIVPDMSVPSIHLGSGYAGQNRMGGQEWDIAREQLLRVDQTVIEQQSQGILPGVGVDIVSSDWSGWGLSGTPHGAEFPIDERQEETDHRDATNPNDGYIWFPNKRVKLKAEEYLKAINEFENWDEGSHLLTKEVLNISMESGNIMNVQVNDNAIWAVIKEDDAYNIKCINRKTGKEAYENIYEHSTRLRDIEASENDKVYVLKKYEDEDNDSVRYSIDVFDEDGIVNEIYFPFDNEKVRDIEVEGDSLLALSYNENNRAKINLRKYDASSADDGWNEIVLKDGTTLLSAKDLLSELDKRGTSINNLEITQDRYGNINCILYDVASTNSDVLHGTIRRLENDELENQLKLSHFQLGAGDSNFLDIKSDGSRSLKGWDLEVRNIERIKESAIISYGEEDDNAIILTGSHPTSFEIYRDPDYPGYKGKWLAKSYRKNAELLEINKLSDSVIAIDETGMQVPGVLEDSDRSGDISEGDAFKTLHSAAISLNKTGGEIDKSYSIRTELKKYGKHADEYDADPKGFVVDEMEALRFEDDYVIFSRIENPDSIFAHKLDAKGEMKILGVQLLEHTTRVSDVHLNDDETISLVAATKDNVGVNNIRILSDEEVDALNNYVKALKEEDLSENAMKYMKVMMDLDEHKSSQQYLDVMLADPPHGWLLGLSPEERTESSDSQSDEKIADII